MSIKIFFVLVFIFIIISLGYALFYLVKSKGRQQKGKTAKALTVRIGVSLILFVVIFIAYATGGLKPEGIGARIQRLKLQQALNNKSNPSPQKNMQNNFNN